MNVSTKPPVKYGSDLKVGDVIRCLGTDHTITALPAYPNPDRFDFMDERWCIAKSGDWGMTIDPDHAWAQLDNGVWVAGHHYPGPLGTPVLRPRPVRSGGAA